MQIGGIQGTKIDTLECSRCFVLHVMHELGEGGGVFSSCEKSAVIKTNGSPLDIVIRDMRARMSPTSYYESPTFCLPLIFHQTVGL